MQTSISVFRRLPFTFILTFPGFSIIFHYHKLNVLKKSILFLLVDENSIINVSISNNYFDTRTPYKSKYTITSYHYTKIHLVLPLKLPVLLSFLSEWTKKILLKNQLIICILTFLLLRERPLRIDYQSKWFSRNTLSNLR